MQVVAEVARIIRGALPVADKEESAVAAQTAVRRTLQVQVE